MGLFDRLFGGSDQDRFARLLASGIAEAGETAPVRYDAARFCLYTEGEQQHILNLRNAYAEYRAAPRARRAGVLRRFVRTWFTSRKELPADFADARHDLLPVIKSRAEIELTMLQVRLRLGKEADWAYRTVAGHLGLCLAYDLPESMVQIQKDRLDDWGVTLDEALGVAVDNLRGLSGRDFVQPAAGVWLSPYRDNYDAARLALPDLLRRYEVEGDLVAAVPNRDVLVLTGSRDDEGLRYVADLVETSMQQPRPLSPCPVRLDGDTWLPFSPERGHPLYRRYRLMQVKWEGGDYADQAEALRQLHATTGEDVFVASYTAFERAGDVRSRCVWSEGVDTLLPRTDEVCFFRAKGDDDGEVVARVRWERVKEVAGDLMKECGLYPERYRVRAFPDAEQLAALKAAEGPPEG